jgi:Tfp pilus assembly protein PilF
MAKLSQLLLGLLFAVSLFAQVKPKPAQQTGSDINKMIEDQMNKAGLTEAQKQEVRKGMQMTPEMQQQGLDVPSGEYDIRIPAKQASLLQQIPQMGSRQQYLSYLDLLLADCRKTVRSGARRTVDSIIRIYQGNLAALANIGPVLFLAKQPDASVYAMLTVAQANPDIRLIQNNLGAILHLTGYAHKAVPVFQYLLVQQENAELLNNLGQCYLTLGDTAKAGSCFRRCLVLNPQQPEAHCGIGLMKAASGKTAEATEHISQSIRNGYSRTADQLMQKHRMKIRFADVRQLVPEYFSAQHYKPVTPATKTSESLAVQAQFSQMDALTQAWIRKFNAAKREDDAVRRKQIEAAEKNPSKIVPLMQRGQGHLYRTPLSRKAALMMELVYQEDADFNRWHDIKYYLDREEELGRQLSGDLKKLTPANGMYEECQQQSALLDQYLSASAKNYDAYVQKAVYHLYDRTNQLIYWERFLKNDRQYEVTWQELAVYFFRGMNDFHKLQPYHRSDYIAKMCENVKNPEEEKAREDSFEVNCPVNVKADLIIASYKMNCDGWEFEAGKLGKFNMEKNYQTGDFTILLGAGVGTPEELKVLEIGAKGQMFVKFDGDFSPVDIGVKGEAGLETKVGPFTIEEKFITNVGVTSGVNVNINHAGRDIPIFSWSPVSGK